MAIAPLVGMEALRDKYGKLIGSIDTQGDGTQVLRDKQGHRLGEYSPKDNVTRDKYGRRLYVGNMLSKLLEP